MKTNYAFKLFFLLLLSIPSYASNTLDISINQEKKELVAPKGAHYQWFKNDQVLMGESGKELFVKESGEYKVEIVDEKGEKSASTITVAVNAMGAIIKIYTIGDSTVQDYNAGYYPRKGWGQVLPAYFNTDNVQVVNKAVGGTSSKSFYNNQWPAVRDLLLAGDFVFIQFGINDRNSADPNRYAPTGGEFESYLTKFVNETKAKGAFPVLISTARRNAWNADGVTVYDSYHDHPIAVRTMAKSLGVPLIDLDAKAKVAMEAAGQLYCTRFWSNTYVAGEYANYPNGNTDQVHFQEMGAINNASLIVQGIKELSADANVSKLIPFLKPHYTLTTSVNPTGSDDATTRAGNYPQGLTITLKTLPKTGKTFQRWNNASGAQLATTTLTTVTSGIAATSYQAMYAGSVNCTATVSTSGATTFCQGGSVTLTASPGSSYVWKSGTIQVGTASTYKAITAGSYTVEVTYASNCKATSPSTPVKVETPTTWFADADADGKGDPAISLSACAQPTAFVADNTDLCPQDVNKTTPGNCGCGKTETSCVDCNNSVNGTATLDNCDRCINGTTGKVACTGAAEVETEACSYEGVTETLNAGFKGVGYVNLPNVLGTTIVFKINALNAGAATLSFRYANGGVNDRTAQIMLNGTVLSTLLSFPITKAFTSWSTIDLKLTLVKGLNEIKLIASTADGLANMDQIGYVTPSLEKACLTTDYQANLIKESVNVFPNPFASQVEIHALGLFDYQIYDLVGNEVEKGSAQNRVLVGDGLHSGLYQIRILQSGNVRFWKVSKL